MKESDFDRDWEADDVTIPAHWDPTEDADERWQSIVSMMREADEAPMPLPAQFDAIKLAALKGAGVTGAPDRTADESFFGWLRHTVFGGGAGAQAFRMACGAAVAFLVGWQFSPRSAPSPTPGTGAAPAAEVRGAAPAGDDLAAANSGSQTAPRPANEPAPLNIPTESMLVRSGLTEDGRLRSVQQVNDNWGFDHNALGSNAGWIVEPQPAFTTVGNTPGAGSAAMARQEAVEALQQLRFLSLVRRDQDGLNQVRRLEWALKPMLMQDEAAGAIPRAENAALESYRRGEELAAANRHAEALESFGQARRLVPGSFLAFLSQYQIARIQYEVLKDYPAARESYRIALEEYPAHFLTDEHKATILDRMEELTRAGRPE
ncbi:MAG: hypothetical protein RLY93_15595 [Sumerlaeia bacterium]